MISHHKHLSCFLQLYNGMTAQVFWLSRDHVTLSEHQGHSTWNQTVESSHVKHRTKLETNWFTNVQTQRNINCMFNKITLAEFSFPWILLVQNEFSMNFNKPTGCGNILNFIQIYHKISEKVDTEVFDFSYNCESQGHLNQYQSVELSSPYFYA